MALYLDVGIAATSRRIFRQTVAESLRERYLSRATRRLSASRLAEWPWRQKYASSVPAASTATEMPTAVVGTQKVRAVVPRALEKGNGSSAVHTCWWQSDFLCNWNTGSASLSLVDIAHSHQFEVDFQYSTIHQPET
jgi:hypothetical protein